MQFSDISRTLIGERSDPSVEMQSVYSTSPADWASLQSKESLNGIVANVLDCNIVSSEFKLQSHYYIAF